MDINFIELAKSMMVGFAILLVIGVLVFLFPAFMLFSILILLVCSAAAILGLITLQLKEDLYDNRK